MACAGAALVANTASWPAARPRPHYPRGPTNPAPYRRHLALGTGDRHPERDLLGDRRFGGHNSTASRFLLGYRSSRCCLRHVRQPAKVRLIAISGRAAGRRALAIRADDRDANRLLNLEHLLSSNGQAAVWPPWSSFSAIQILISDWRVQLVRAHRCQPVSTRRPRHPGGHRTRPQPSGPVSRPGRTNRPRTTTRRQRPATLLSVDPVCGVNPGLPVDLSRWISFGLPDLAGGSRMKSLRCCPAARSG
jgi:hypothetical protein